MKADPMTCLSNQEFDDALQRLNALSGPAWLWQSTVAVKTHTDEFGVQIEKGDNYFKRQCGAAFDATLKLSRASMDKLLYAVVVTCPTAEGVADLLLEEEKKSLRALSKRVADLG